MKKSIIDTYKKRNDKLFHFFDHLSLRGTKRILKVLLFMQAAMVIYGLVWSASYLSQTGEVISLLLILWYDVNVNEANRRSAIYKLFAWILILPSAFDLGSELLEPSWIGGPMALNALFLLSGATMYGEFLKIRQEKEALFLL